MNAKDLTLPRMVRPPTVDKQSPQGLAPRACARGQFDADGSVGERTEVITMGAYDDIQIAHSHRLF